MLVVTGYHKLQEASYHTKTVSRVKPATTGDTMGDPLVQTVRELQNV